MTKRTVETELRVKVDQYISGMMSAKKSTDTLAASQEKAKETTEKLGKGSLATSQGWKQVSSNMVVAGTAAAEFGLALPTVAAANFEAAMAQVSATGPEAKRSLSDLAVVARESATDIDGTGFSAVQAAGGIEALIKAGVSVEDVMGGAMTGALSLAAAGQLSVAEAAETAASAMTQFKLEGKDVPHIADLLAAGAGKAQGDVSDLTMALSQSGLVASQTGLSIEETVGSLAAFASAGLLGSDAGTSFRNMLLRLSNPSGDAAKTMAELGISAYDVAGNFIGIPKLAQNLQTSLKGLSQETRTAALANIFGTDSIRAASIMYEQGASGMQNWINATNDSGYAAEVARERLNSLNGDLQKLWGVLGEVGIAAGEANTGPLRGLVQVITDLLRAASENPEVLQIVATGIGLIGAAALTFGITMKLVSTVVQFKENVAKLKGAGVAAGTGMDSATKSTGKFNSAVGKVGSVAGKAVTALLALSIAANAFEMFEPAAAGVDEVSAAVTRLQGKKGTLDSVFQTSSGGAMVDAIGQKVDSLDSAMERFATRGWKYADTVDGVMSGLTGTSSVLTELKTQFGLLDSEMTNLRGDEAANTFDQIKSAADRAKMSNEDLISLFPQYVGALQKQAAANGKSKLSTEELILAMQTGLVDTEALTEATESSAAASETDQSAKYAQVQALEDLAAANDAALKAAQGLGEGMLKLSGSQIGVEQSIADLSEILAANTEEYGRNAGGLDLSTEAGRENKKALDDLANSSMKYIGTLEEQGASSDEVAAATQRARDAWIKGATAMGMSEDQARDLADAYFAIPQDVETTIATPGMGKSQADADNLNNKLRGLPDYIKSDIVAIFDRRGADAAEAALADLSRDRTVLIKTILQKPSTVITADMRASNPYYLNKATGGIVEYYRNGGLRENHVAEIAPAGAMRVWSEPETGGEGYIPLAESKRPRSMAVLTEIANRFGYMLVKQANGGVMSNWTQSSPSPTIDTASIAAAVRQGLAGATFMMDGEVIDIRLSEQSKAQAAEHRRYRQ